MEAGTAAAAPQHGTGSKTIADLMLLAAEKYADQVAVKHQVDGEWRDVTFREVGEVVSEIGRGLIALGINAGDRVAILCNTRPEWTYCDFAITSAGGVVVPIYPTNSPSECEWVAGNSESIAVVCENASQVEKINQVRGNLPNLEHIIVVDDEGASGEGLVTLDEVRERGRAGEESELRARADAVTTEDPFTFIYTSGTTGPPKGCVLTHGNYRAILDSVNTINLLSNEEDLTYLYLPLAHSFALLIQLASFDVGVGIAYFGGDTKQIIGELAAVKPTYLPSVPRIFEKIYTLVAGQMDDETIKKATQVGLAVRYAESKGGEVPEEVRAAFDQFEEKLYVNVRAAFGGRLRQATTGAAPIAKEILEFFFACGVPVMEGYGMTETATASTISTIEEHKFGTVGKPLPGVEVKIAEDGELLVKGGNIFKGYYKMEDKAFGDIADGWLHTGDLGSIDEEGFVSIVGRKKDIIITAGGKNLTPANLENDLKQSRWISQAVMFGDRKPYPVALITLDPEEILPWAKENGLPEDLAALSTEPKVQELVQEVLDKVNSNYAQVEQIKKFTILDHDLSQETGELTPTLKVKRNVVYEQYADKFESLYQS